MKLKGTCAALIAALTVAGITTAVAQAPSGGGATVRYQVYNSINETVLRVAEVKFCATYGLTCTGVLLPSGPLGIQALMGDGLEIGFSATDAIVRAVDNGAGVKMVSGFIDRVPYYVVVRSDLDVPGKGYKEIIQSLNGKSVGVTARGAGVELTFDLLVRAAGLASTDVNYVGVGGPVTALGSLKSKQIDAAILFQPMPGLCKSTKVCRTVIDLLQDEIPESVSRLNGAATTIIAKEGYIEKNPQVIQAYVAAFKDAEKWVVDPKNFDELKAIAKRFVKIETANADEIIENGLREQVKNTDSRIKISAVQAYIDLLAERKLVKRPLTPKDLIWPGAQTR